MRVQQADRALQGDRQAPMLASPYGRPIEPAQLQAPGQFGAARARLIQLEAHALRSSRRQADDPALQPKRAAIQARGQAIIQGLLGRPAGPAQPQHETAQWP